MKNNQRKIKKFTAIVILLAFGLSIIGPASFALTDDLYGHWAEKELRQMQSDGLISGYPDGTFRPDGQITRAEFAALIVRGFNLAKAEGKIFADTRGHWAQDAIATANAHGAVSGYSDSEFGPDNLISREQVAAMIVKAAKLAERKADVNFADQNTISLWAKEAVETALANKLMNGYPDNTFRAKGNATRAEAAVVLLNAMGVKAQEEALVNLAKIEKAGTYGPATGILEIKGDVKIMAAGVTLQNLVIKGDLIIAEEVGDGDVTLNNIKVEGKTHIRGGGKDSIHINGGEYSEIIIERTSEGGVRIVAIDNNNLKIIVAEDAKDEEIILSGEIKSLTVNADGVKITTQQDTKIEELKIQSGLKDVEIDLAAGTNVKEMLVESKVSVKGDGEIEKASGGQAQNSNYENRPDTIVAPPSSGGGSSGGGSTTVAVSAISVKGTGDVATITTKDGTLQMIATVSPANASNKAVTWNVDNTSIATIDGNGKLTAVANGTVTVTATAKDGSNVKGTTTIEISGQTVAPTITSVTISPKTTSVQKGTDETFTATVEGTGAFDSTVTWSVSGGVSGTTLDTNGKLSVDASETAATLIVTATSNGDNSKSDSATITVTDAPVVKHTVTVTSGTGGGDYAEGATVNITASAAPTGKVFDKWTSTDGVTFADANSASTSFTMLAKAVTVEATYKVKEYTVTFKDYNDTVLDTQTVEHGSDATAPTDPTRTGYTFTGWDTGFTNVTSDLTATAQYTKDAEPFVAVTNIKDVPTKGIAESQIDLTTATVEPNNATNKAIVWSVKNAGTTGVTTADLSTGKFTPASAGTLELTATITNGKTENTNYTQDFNITVTAAPDKIVTLKNIPGITIPAENGVPVTAVGANDQYTGTVAWSPSVVDNKFGLGQIYTATIVLTAKKGYTLDGITEANFFSVIGADSTTYDSSSKTVTVKFPTTGDKPAQTGSPTISGDPIYGVGLMAQSEGLGQVFGGVTFTWYRSEDANFDESTDTLLTSTGTSGQNYTIDEADIGKYLIVKAVNPNSTGYGFRVIGPVVKANVVGDVTGSISAYYLSDGNALYIRGINPDQGKLEAAVAIDGTNYDAYQVIGTGIKEADISSLSGVDANTKVKIRKAATTTHNASKDKVIEGEKVKVRHKLTLVGENLAVDKTPDVFGDHKTYADNEYLKLTVTPPTGNVIDSLKIGVEEKRDSLNGNNELWFNIKADTTITVTYTTIQKVDIAAIEGVTAPEVGATPVTSITETVQYTGTISWDPNQNPFNKDTVYTATITLTAKHPYSLDGVAANFFTVAGATSVTNAANTGVVTAVFPKTGAEQVSDFTILSHHVVKPVKDETPKTNDFTGSGTQFDGTIKWYEQGNETEATGLFKGNTVYIAKVSLTAKDGYTFAESMTFTHSEADSVTFTIDPSDSKKGLVTITFPATEDYPGITDFPFKATDNLQEGNANVVVGAVAGTLEGYVSGGTSPFTFSLVEGEGGADNAKFEIDGTDLKIIKNPLTEGTYSVRVQIKDTHDKTLTRILTFYVSAKEAVAPITDTPVSASAVTEGQTLAASTLSGTFKNADGDAVAGTLAWTDDTTVVNATGDFEWTFTPDDQVAYNVITGNVEVTANPVIVPAVDPLADEAVAATAVTVGQTLADSTLSGTFKNASNEAVAGTLAWTDDTTVVNATGNFEWTFTPTDQVSYNIITGTVNVIANPVKIEVNDKEVELIEGNLTLDGIAGVEGTLSWDSSSSTLTMTNFVGKTLDLSNFEDEITIELEGKNKLATTGNVALRFFGGPTTIKGSSGSGKLEIEAKLIGISYGSWNSTLTIEDSATVIVKNECDITSNPSGIYNAMGGGVIVNGDAKLNVTVKYTGSWTQGVLGINGKITNNSTNPVNILVENIGDGGVSLNNSMPDLYNGQTVPYKNFGYKGIVSIGKSEGAASNTAIKITYYVDESTALIGDNIRVGTNSVGILWSDEFDGKTIITKNEPITFDETTSNAIVFAKHSDLYYEITIIKADPTP